SAVVWGSKGRRFKSGRSDHSPPGRTAAAPLVPPSETLLHRMPPLRRWRERPRCAICARLPFLHRTVDDAVAARLQQCAPVEPTRGRPNIDQRALETKEMNLHLLRGGLISAAVASGILFGMAASAHDGHHEAVTAEDVVFKPGPPTLPPGAEIAVLHG